MADNRDSPVAGWEGPETRPNPEGGEMTLVWTIAWWTLNVVTLILCGLQLPRRRKAKEITK